MSKVPRSQSSRVAAVEGWFSLPEAGGDPPHLIGSRCSQCGTYVFPPRSGNCPSPHCSSTELESVPLSRRGRLWSYTENHYAPPPPYVAAEPFEPYALAAVELATEGMVILGQVTRGVRADELRVGMPMELELDTLFVDEDGTEHVVYSWSPAAPSEGEL